MTTASAGMPGIGSQGEGSRPGLAAAGPGYVSKTDMVAALIRSRS